MPKRWERELRRLNDLEAPDERLKVRAAAPPREGGGSEGAPSTRQRIIAGAVAFGVFLAAGAFGWQALRPEAPLGLPPATPPQNGSLVLRIESPRPGAGDLFREDSGASATLTNGPIGLRGLLVTYTWCGEAGQPCDAGTLDYDLVDFLPVDPGMEVRVDSEAAEVRGRFHMWGVDDQPSSMQEGTPSEPGSYELLVDATFPEGSVQFSVGVEVVRHDPPASTGEASDVLRIRCRAGRVRVFTPKVAATADGVQVVVLPDGPTIPIEFRAFGVRGSFGGDIDADGRPHPWPIRPGRTEVDCGPDALEFLGAATFEVVDPEGHWASPELACSESGRTEVVGYDGGAAEWVDEGWAISGILRGVERDQVRLPVYRGVKDTRWVIVRDGRTVGVVWFDWVTDRSDPKGGGLGRVTGEVCAGLGIEGNVPPRDPDEDGVALDCQAGLQVAFRHRGGTLLPLGEAAVRANVPGIRDTDVLMPPEDGSGEGGYDGIWRVEREGRTVASIVYPSFDGITCRWSAIGMDPSEL